MHLLSSHPSRADLLEFAEMLERNAGHASAAVHAHVSECPQCSEEVERARATFAVSAHAAALEPRREWRAQMLLTARQVRGREAATSGHSLLRSNSRAMAATTAFVLVASLSVIAVQYVDVNIDPAESAVPSQATVFPLDVLRQATLEERILAPAVLTEATPETPWEASRRRAVHAWDAEIDEALAALESNPACARAATVVHTNRERMGETLKVLYVERNFQ